MHLKIHADCKTSVEKFFRRNRCFAAMPGCNRSKRYLWGNWKTPVFMARQNINCGKHYDFKGGTPFIFHDNKKGPRCAIFNTVLLL